MRTSTAPLPSQMTERGWTLPQIVSGEDDMSELSLMCVFSTPLFDPHPESLRAPNPQASEQLRCSLNKPCAFLHVLVPDAEKIEHDHSYCLKPSTFTDIPSAEHLYQSIHQRTITSAWHVHLVQRRLLKGK